MILDPASTKDDEEIMKEIERLEKAINNSNISKLHKLIIYLSLYHTWSNKHVLDPLTRQEFNKVFRLCGFEPPQISDDVFQQFNEIHRVEPMDYNISANGDLSIDEVKQEINHLLKVIKWA
jgi:hypothetical protein